MWAWFVVLLVAIISCDFGQVTFTREEADGVERGAMTVRVLPDSADRERAAALGWEDGVPAARVTLIREPPAGVVPIGDSITATTDSTGRVTVEGLLPGETYRVSAARRLTGEEREAVADRWPAFRAAGGGTKITAPNDVTVSVGANRADGLVFSEFYFQNKPTGTGAGANYDFGGYVELYNQGESTVYLDGMVIGTFYAFDVDFESFPCRETTPYQTDSSGLWARIFEAFPGDGGEHLLAPGERVVIATDAIDHSEVAPEYPDLRDADFEFAGGPDNPDVPDMVDVGLEPDPTGHGLGGATFTGVPENAFLSAPVNVESLERGRPLPDQDDVYVQIPAVALADVVTSSWGGWDERDDPFCRNMVNDRFDRLSLMWDHPPDRALKSAQRPVVGSVGGRDLLLDTNTSQVDLGVAPRTPEGLWRP